MHNNQYNIKAHRTPQTSKGVMKIYFGKLQLCGSFKLGRGGATAERGVAAFSANNIPQLKQKASRRSVTVPSCDISNITPTCEVMEQSD